MMRLYINIKNNLYKEYGVHYEHECDLYDYLKEYSNKRKITKTYTIKEYKEYNFKQTIQYFFINPTKEDIKFILNTCWFKNNSWENKNLKQELENTKEITILIIE